MRTWRRVVHGLGGRGSVAQTGRTWCVVASFDPTRKRPQTHCRKRPCSCRIALPCCIAPWSNALARSASRPRRTATMINMETDKIVDDTNNANVQVRPQTKTLALSNFIPAPRRLVYFSTLQKLFSPSVKQLKPNK